MRSAGGVLFVAIALAAAAAAAEAPAPDLSGLWAAKLRYGPDIRGPLVLIRRPGGWRADLGGVSIPVAADGGRVSFVLPDGKGSFRGRRLGRDIVGQWIQEKSATGGIAYATPLTLVPDGPGRWRGDIEPLPETFTYYLPLKRQGQGYAAYLRNPERNQGRFIPVSALQLDGERVRLTGRRGGQAADATLAEGRYDRENDVLSMPLRGSSFDFLRADADSTSPFYARGKAGERYHYAVPLHLDDGWPVASLKEVGIDQAGIERFVQKLIDMPQEGVGTSQVHSLLIARHGKLVLEEYFHGYGRDTPHDIRSAGKSLTATLIGAAMLSGVPIREDMPVYRTMLGTLPPGLDARKAQMTLRHLMTMNSGHFCDDRNDDAPGNENAIQAQTEYPDLYGYILRLPMDRTPGEKIVYCSADALLAGGLLAKEAGEPLPELFQRLVAAPLRMGRYHLNLTPAGELYTAGGFYFRTRDFMKLPQLMLNGGTWGRKRIVSREWVRRASAPLYDLSPIQQYGYFWNSALYPWKGRKVRAVFAAGNGGQIFMEIPDLDLVIAFTSGNYSEAAGLLPQRVFIPEDILPAVN
ncbi:MAG TPA: serine hydrolase domain-containing protein [Allosphingosinicella sp.]|jgi:CubicO group peptidase (beta-lactamase class C family)